VLAVLSAMSAVVSAGVAVPVLAATRSGAIPPMVAAGPGGRALLAWGSPGGVRVRERGVSGGWGPVGAISGPQVYPELVAWGPRDAVAVLATDQSEVATGQQNAVRKLIVFRRAPGSQSFQAPSIVAQGRPIVLSGAAADASGAIAIVAQLDQATVLLTAAGGGAWAAPQQLASSEAAVAVGAGGRVVVAYYDWQRRGVYVRTGRAGSALGAARLLSARRTPAFDIVTAIDGAGNATIAFTIDDPDDRHRRAALVVTRRRPGGRFGPLMVVGRGGPPQLGAGFASVQIAAAGATTALLWDPNPPDDPHGDDGRLKVAIARGAGRFARAQSPSSPATRTTWLSMPAVTVNDAGDVLLTYAYANAVHASQRSVRSPRFGAPHVVSTLGSGRIRPGALQGGATAAAALLSNHRPLIVYNNLQGENVVVSTLSGPRPDLTAPHTTVTLPPSTTAQLLTTSVLSATIRCSETCIVQAHATLRTDTGRTVLYEDGADIVRPGDTLAKHFAFDPTKKAGRARANARVTLTVTVENTSGATATTRRPIKLGARPSASAACARHSCAGRPHRRRHVSQIAGAVKLRRAWPAIPLRDGVIPSRTPDAPAHPRVRTLRRRLRIARRAAPARRPCRRSRR